MEIFGFEITRKKDELRDTTDVGKQPSFVPPVDDDGTPVIETQQSVGLLQVVRMVPMLTWKVVSRMRLNSFVDIVKLP